MSSESQREPFLGYSDRDRDYDEDSTKEEARRYRNVQRTGRNYLPHLMLIFITSFFWAGLFYLFHPSECHDMSTVAAASSSPSAPQQLETSQAPSSHLGSGHGSTTSTSTSPSPRPLNVTSHAHLLTCGASVAEARAQGCEYDILLNNWVPAPCYAREFVDDYADENGYSDARGWGAYADEALTRPLALREMAEAPYYWTSLRDHVTHCAVLWKKQFATLFEFEGRGVVDTVLASPGHTDHCAQFLMDFGWRNWTGPTKTEMGFAGCWVRDGS